MDGKALIFKGFLIGLLMLFPGFSGGSLACFLGVYGMILSDASSLTENFRISIRRLGLIFIGWAAGALIFCLLISRFAAAYETVFASAVAVAMAVTLPFFALHSNADFKRPLTYILIAAGSAAGVLSSYIPRIEGSENHVLLFSAGMLISLALVLPGISFSYMMYALGLYNGFINAVASADIMYIIIFSGGVIAGIFISAKLISAAYKRFPSQTDSLIIGFLAASVVQSVQNALTLLTVSSPI